jgi:hypothetical protein
MLEFAECDGAEADNLYQLIYLTTSTWASPRPYRNAQDDIPATKNILKLCKK